MEKEFLYNFISKHKYAVLSTVSSDGLPEAALVGFAVAPDLRLIIDTVRTSRKFKNLTQNSRIALVIGWDNEQTLQYEGRVVFQAGKEFNKMLGLYLKAFPDAMEREKYWKDIAHFIVVPEWIRYSDFNDPPTIDETDFLPYRLRSDSNP
jgi:uncharacterized pyridoxamine 5'-phosphate oxidase family protein